MKVQAGMKRNIKSRVTLRRGDLKGAAGVRGFNSLENVLESGQSVYARAATCEILVWVTTVFVRESGYLGAIDGDCIVQTA